MDSDIEKQSNVFMKRTNPNKKRDNSDVEIQRIDKINNKMEEVMRTKLSFLSFGTDVDNISIDEDEQHEQDEKSSNNPLDFLENDKK